jgi:hypothetical protein
MGSRDLSSASVYCRLLAGPFRFALLLFQVVSQVTPRPEIGVNSNTEEEGKGVEAKEESLMCSEVSDVAVLSEWIEPAIDERRTPD